MTHVMDAQSVPTTPTVTPMMMPQHASIVQEILIIHSQPNKFLHREAPVALTVVSNNTCFLSKN